MRDLSSARPEIRVSSIEDLTRHARGDDDVRARAVPLLVARLSDDHPRVRSAAAVALGDLEATDAVTALLVAVEDDDAHVRQMALNALGEIKDARALPRLRRALGDERPEVRYQAVIAFARVAAEPGSNAADEIDGALLDAMNDDDDAVVHIALRVAEERFDRGRSPDPRILTRAHALLESSSAHVALVSAIFLSKTGDERGQKLVLAVVRGEGVRGQPADKEDERASVELVGELGIEAAVPHLERRAWGLARWVRDTCAFEARTALARMGNARAKKEILEDLRSNKRDVLSAAVVAAGRARIEQARAAIERLTAAAVDPELTRDALAELDRAKEAK